MGDISCVNNASVCQTCLLSRYQCNIWSITILPQVVGGRHAIIVFIMRVAFLNRKTSYAVMTAPPVYFRGSWESTDQETIRKAISEQYSGDLAAANNPIRPIEWRVFRYILPSNGDYFIAQSSEGYIITGTTVFDLVLALRSVGQSRTTPPLSLLA